MLCDVCCFVQCEVVFEVFEIGVYFVIEEQFVEIFGVFVWYLDWLVVDVSWLCVVYFCNVVLEWEGFDCVYLFDGEDVSWDMMVDGY